jgi:glycosyltransferase involved in cell wall biosynthesis
MQDVAMRFIGADQEDIPVIPFFHEIQCHPQPREDKFRFLYVSEGYPHKNHSRLFHAFEQAWKTNPDMVLYVTIGNGFPKLLKEIQTFAQRGVPIVNEGFLPHDQLIALYGRVKAQVYPSLTEAFGIGLIESALTGLPVIATNRPYVHELIQPCMTFDPTDVSSIARCLISTRNSENLPPATLNIHSQHEELAELILSPRS